MTNRFELIANILYDILEIVAHSFNEDSVTNRMDPNSYLIMADCVEHYWETVL